MTYNVVQPQKTKTGTRYYLYEVTAEWDPEKKRAKQKRRYLGPCEEDGTLIKEPARKQVIVRSPSYGPYYILDHIAKESGLDGVVCSPLEAQKVHDVCGKDFLTVTPGVRFADGDVGDQKRIMTPAQAKEIGSDYIVVGRPITAADDPVSAYLRCVEDFVD